MTSVWARIALAIDAADRMRGWSRWIAGAAVWTVFAAVCISPLACAYLLGASR